MSTPRYQHILFYKLKIGEDFFFRKLRYTKTAYLLGRTVLDGNAALVMPWTKVRSTRPFGPIAPRVVGHIAKVLAANVPYLNLVNETRPLNVLTRPPQTVTPGGDRRSETIGGNELTPSA